MFFAKIGKKVLIGALALSMITSGTSTIAAEDNVFNHDNQVVFYQVQPGDTLSSIAEYYNLDVQLISLMNDLPDENIEAKQVLVIPNEQSIVYKVQLGDTLSGIADRYNISMERLVKENEIYNVNDLQVGMKLAISAPLDEEINSTMAFERNQLSFLWPVDGVISSSFGKRDGQKHEGLDIAADKGVPIKASRSGRVIFAGTRGTYGKTVIIEHQYGYTTLYAHTSKILVDDGDKVDAGQEIALIGSTGKSTGPHLHFEIRKNSNPIDPITLLPKKR